MKEEDCCLLVAYFLHFLQWMWTMNETLPSQLIWQIILFYPGVSNSADFVTKWLGLSNEVSADNVLDSISRNSNFSVAKATLHSQMSVH